MGSRISARSRAPSSARSVTGVGSAADAAGSATPTVDANAQASALTAFTVGRLQRFTRSGFKRSPTEHLDAALQLLTA